MVEVSVVGQTKGDMAKVSLEVMVTEQGPASALPIPSTVRETVLVEASWQEGPAVPMSNEESSWDLTWVSGSLEAWGRPQIEWVDPRNPGAIVFALYDTAEGSEWRGLHTSMGGVA
jgi:hypothetical protein